LKNIGFFYKNFCFLLNQENFLDIQLFEGVSSSARIDRKGNWKYQAVGRRRTDARIKTLLCFQENHIFPQKQLAQINQIMKHESKTLLALLDELQVNSYQIKETLFVLMDLASCR